MTRLLKLNRIVRTDWEAQPEYFNPDQFVSVKEVAVERSLSYGETMCLATKIEMSSGKSATVENNIADILEALQVVDVPVNVVEWEPIERRRAND